jgi:hypothetical protein
MYDPKYLDTLVGVILPHNQQKEYEKCREYIVLNIMNQDSSRYLNDPYGKQKFDFMDDFKKDIMKITMILMAEEKVVMNQSTDVTNYKKWLADKDNQWISTYLLLFDIKEDISKEVDELDKLLYQRICENTTRLQHTTGDGWEIE